METDLKRVYAMKSEICRKWLLLCQTRVRLTHVAVKTVAGGRHVGCVSQTEDWQGEEPIRRSMKTAEAVLATFHTYAVSLGSDTIVFCPKIIVHPNTAWLYMVTKSLFELFSVLYSILLTLTFVFGISVSSLLKNTCRCTKDAPAH